MESFSALMPKEFKTLCVFSVPPISGKIHIMHSEKLSLSIKEAV